MRRTALCLVALNLLVLCALPGSAGEDKEATAIIEKAIKAHFPKGMDPKKEAVRTKSKGTLHAMGLKLDYISEVSVQGGRFKEAVELEFMGKKANVVTVFNGKEGWIRADDKDVKVNEDILAELKDAAYIMSIMKGAFTKEKKVKYALAGEVQVKGKAANGMILSREGKKDINLFFDKTSGLIVKIEMRKRDLMSGQEVTEERFITEYQEIGGQKVAKKFEIQRDGKVFLEGEVTDVQVLDKLDDGEFAQPK
jgi:hypothetical protein